MEFPQDSILGMFLFNVTPENLGERLEARRGVDSDEESALEDGPASTTDEESLEESEGAKQSCSSTHIVPAAAQMMDPEWSPLLRRPTIPFRLLE